MHEVRVLPTASRDLDSLDMGVFIRVKAKIISLAAAPRPAGAVKLTNQEGYRIRTGNYRVLYRVDDKAKIIFIYRVKHRKEAYR